MVVASGSATVRLDPFWADLAADRHAAISPTERRRLREYLTRARTFLTGLEERAATLLRVARHVAVRQHRFLREGPAAHAPLTRAEVAAAIGVHESTVSRAVAGKRVRLPDGRVVGFATLFGASGSVQATLKAIVAAETRPLSDTELADELLKLVRQRQEILRDAWLTATGHKRPGINKGLPLAEARRRAATMEKEIRALVKGR